MDALVNLLGRRIDSETAMDVLRGFRCLNAAVENLAPDEGLPPQYYLASESEGIEIRHSGEGEILTIFLMGQGKDDYSQFQGDLGSGLDFSATYDQIVAALGPPTVLTPARKIGDNTYGQSLRYDSRDHSVHFQMRQDGLGIEMVTLMTRAATPGR